MTNEELRQRLIQARTEAKLTQEELAKRMKVSRPRVVQIEAEIDGGMERALPFFRWMEACGLRVEFVKADDKDATILARTRDLLARMSDRRRELFEAELDDLEELVKNDERKSAFGR